MVHIQFPQRPNQANRSARSVELKLISGRFCKMDLCSSGSKSGPPEAIGRTQRTQLGKIPGRILGHCRLPIRRQRAGAEREQQRDEALRRKFAWCEHLQRSAAVHESSLYGRLVLCTQKIHASLARVYLRMVERN